MKTKKSRVLLCTIVAVLLAILPMALFACNGDTKPEEEHKHSFVLVAENSPDCITKTDGCQAYYKCLTVSCGKIFIKVGNEYKETSFDELKIDYKEAHDWKLVGETYATCNEKGLKAHYECQKCGDFAIKEDGVYIEKSKAELETEGKAHTWGVEIPATESTCNKQGMKAHYRCSNCGTYSVGAEHTITSVSKLLLPLSTNHSWGNLISEVSETCETDGSIAHYECSVCHKFAVKEGENFVLKTDVEITKPKSHNWQFVSEVDANCTTAGTKEHYKCSRCNSLSVKQGDVYKAVTQTELTISAHHTFGAETPIQNANCTTAGAKAHYVCVNCSAWAEKVGDNYNVHEQSYFAIPITHDWQFVEESQINCTVQGTKAHYKCSKCNALSVKNGDNYNSVTADDLIIPPGTHKYSTYNGTKNKYICKCGAEKGSPTLSLIDLNLTDKGGEYVATTKSQSLNVAEYGLESDVTVKIGEVAISSGVTFVNGTLNIPYSAFKISQDRYYYGEKTLTVSGKTEKGATLSVNYPVLIITKTIMSTADLQDMGTIAILQADNSTLSSEDRVKAEKVKYEGYFVLGADIDCGGGRYTMVKSASGKCASDVGGFSGVFDGQGYTIKNLQIGSTSAWYNEMANTPDDFYGHYSFIGRLNGGTVKNINFSEIIVSVLGSMVAQSGYGNITNVYAQVKKIAIIKQFENGTTKYASFSPMGFAFGQSGSTLSTISQVIVDFTTASYCALNKDNGNLEEIEFVENYKLFNVFGEYSPKLQDCYVIGYAGHDYYDDNNQVYLGETLYDSFAEMTKHTNDYSAFNKDMFKEVNAKSGKMLLPVSFVDKYNSLDKVKITVTGITNNSQLSIGGSIDVNLGDFDGLPKGFVTVTITPTANGIVFDGKKLYVNSDATKGDITIKFACINGAESDTFTLKIVDLYDGIFDDCGDKIADSALKSGAVKETNKLGNYDMYKLTVTGYNPSLANTSINVNLYSELYFAFKIDKSGFHLADSNNGNPVTADTWYIVKVARQANGSWKYYMKTAGGSYEEKTVNYGNKTEAITFEDMFKIWTWGETEITAYATGVYGKPMTTFGNIFADCGDKIVDSALNNGEQINGGEIYSKKATTTSGGVSIANTELKSNMYKELYFAVMVDSNGLSLADSDGTNKLQKDCWYIVKYINEDGVWKCYIKMFGGSYEEKTVNYGGSKAVTFDDMLKFWIWQSCEYTVYTSGVYGKSIYTDMFSNCGDKIADSALKSEAVKETNKLGNYDVYKLTVTGYNPSLANTSINVNLYSELYFAFKIDKSGFNLAHSGGGNPVTADTWYIVKVVRQADGSWKYYMKTAGGSYEEKTVNYGAKTEAITFEDMFKIWTWGETEITAYATGVYGKPLDFDEIFDGCGDKIVDSALKSGSQLECNGTYSLAVSKGWAESIANTSVTLTNYTEIYFAIMVTDSGLSLADSGGNNSLTKDVWNVVKYVKQADGTWKCFVKSVGGEYVEKPTNQGSTATTFDKMLIFYKWDGPAFTAYASGIWAK